MSIETLAQPIRANSLEEHERELEFQVAQASLEYVDRLYSHKIPPMEEDYLSYEDDEKVVKKIPFENLSFLLNRYSTALRDLIRYQLDQKEDTDVDEVRRKFENEIAGFYQDDKNTWIQKTLSLLKSEREKAEVFQKNNPKISNPNIEVEKDDRDVGIANFNFGKMSEDGDSITPGLKKGEVYLALHVSPLYKKSFSKEEVNIFSESTLKDLAVRVIEKYPEVRTIEAKSWLMDTPIAKRVGFNVVEREKFAFIGSFWGQFINEKGQIHQERLKKFLETGQAPYQVASGYIPVEEFLRKYLPKERKGKIILKEPSPDFDLDKTEEELEKWRRVYRSWDTLSVDDLESFFKNEVYISNLLKKAGLGDFYQEYILELKRKGKKMEELDRDVKLKELEIKFNAYLKSVEFRNKEVVIE